MLSNSKTASVRAPVVASPFARPAAVNAADFGNVIAHMLQLISFTRDQLERCFATLDHLLTRISEIERMQKVSDMRVQAKLNRAVDLARKFDFTLDIAGGSRWKLLGRSKTRREGVFFRSLSARYRFHGMVDGEDKLRLLGQSKAFLNPISWEEPFGMAQVEAMLCGTPVLTTPRGALVETVDADTGRFFETDKEFGRGFAEIGGLSAQRCRQSAADRFPIEKTAKAYLELYARILDGEALP